MSVRATSVGIASLDWPDAGSFVSWAFTRNPEHCAELMTMEGKQVFGVALWAFRLRAFQLLSWTYSFPPTFGFMCGFNSQGPHGVALMGVSAMGVSDVATG